VNAHVLITNLEEEGGTSILVWSPVPGMPDSYCKAAGVTLAAGAHIEVKVRRRDELVLTGLPPDDGY